MNVRAISLLLLMTISILSCRKRITGHLSGNDPAQKYLVSKVYDYRHRLLAQYEYNDSNQLLRRSFTDPETQNSSEYIFEYHNGRISKIIYSDFAFPQFNHNIVLKYNEAGRIVRDETYQYGALQAFTNYRYDPDGKIKSLVDENGLEYFTIDYKQTANALQVRLMVKDGDGWIGNGYREVTKSFTYDDHPKPDFGLGQVFKIEPLPGFGTEATFEKNISRNNMTVIADGTTWIYTYNDHGLPATIETKWKDVITEPMMLRIEYMKAQ